MDYGIDQVKNATGVDVGLVPPFEEEVLEDRGDHEVVQQNDGVRVLRRKFMATIPKPMSHLLADRASWERHYKARLDPTHPDRYPPDWDERTRTWTDPERMFSVHLLKPTLTPPEGRAP
jgi:hypothetical protein